MNLFKKKPSLIDQAKEEIARQRSEIQNLNSELIKKNKGFEFVKNYLNEDWNRDTPFLWEINCENIILKYFNFDELESLVGSKQISENHKESLLTAFKHNYNSILELNVAEFLFFIADLKSYKQNSLENGEKTPEEFFLWRLEFITKK